MADDAQSPAKRGRGSSPDAAQEWRDLGLEVPRRLLVMVTVNQAITEVETAHGKLAVIADRTAQALVGLVSLRVHLDVARRASNLAFDVARLSASNPTFDGERLCIDQALKDARREIARFCATHRAACRLFAVYAARQGLIQGGGDDPWWRSWEEHRAEAERRHDAAARRVLCAMAQVHADRDILFMLVEAPARQLGFAMAPAVQQCALRARDEAALALHELREMRHAVILEFFDAWAALSLRR